MKSYSGVFDTGSVTTLDWSNAKRARKLKKIRKDLVITETTTTKIDDMKKKLFLD